MRVSIKTKDMTLIAVGAVWMAICSWITIPSAVPFTLQTFGVFLILGVLGGKKGAASIGLYILIGMTGVPVFAGFQGGLAHLTGPTGGYIVGFVLSALVFMLFEDFAAQSKARTFLVFAIGLVLCYLCGTMWFMVVSGTGFSAVGLTYVIGICVLPYIVPDAVKLYLAVRVAARIRR